MNWERLRRVMPYIAMIMATLALGSAIALYINSAKESKHRRSDTCRVFEGQHLQEITDLKGGYDYLASIPRSKWTQLEKTVYKRLPKQESDAKSDTDQLGPYVPAYCDEEDIGLPEPDPVVPKRPATLK